MRKVAAYAWVSTLHQSDLSLVDKLKEFADRNKDRQPQRKAMF